MQNLSMIQSNAKIKKMYINLEKNINKFDNIHNKMQKKCTIIIRKNAQQNQEKVHNVY